MPSYIEVVDQPGGTYRVQDCEGRLHAYPDEAT